MTLISGQHVSTRLTWPLAGEYPTLSQIHPAGSVGIGPVSVTVQLEPVGMPLTVTLVGVGYAICAVWVMTDEPFQQTRLNLNVPVKPGGTPCTIFVIFTAPTSL